MALSRRVKKRISGALEARGWEINRVSGGRRQPSDAFGTVDFPDEWQAVIERTRPYTLCSDERMGGLIAGVEHVVKNAIPGAFVECGVWRGGSSMAAALTFQHLGDIRDIYLFDTFEGMPPAGEQDVDFRGEPMGDSFADTQATKELAARAGATLGDVREAMASTGYPGDRTHLVQGMVEHTVPGSAPGEIAVLRLDTDWYESTRHELEHLYPRVPAGGVLIVDDYGHFAGARKATDEYLGEKVFLHRLDYTGRLVIKS